MKKLLFLSIFLLFGCEDNRTPRVIDQCLRSEFYQKCSNAIIELNKISPTKDLKTILRDCGDQAYYQSFRLESNIKPECVGGTL